MIIDHTTEYTLGWADFVLIPLWQAYHFNKKRSQKDPSKFMLPVVLNNSDLQGYFFNCKRGNRYTLLHELVRDISRKSKSHELIPVVL